MDRRLFLAAIVAASATPAVAQTTTPSGTASGSGTAVKSAIGAAPADVGMTGTPEKLHITHTMEVGTLSLDMSRIAVQHAEHPHVKQFALFEVAEQETIGGVLKAVKAATNDVSPPPKLDTLANEILAKLRSASGAAFDRAYVENQIAGHQKLMAIQADYLASGKNLDSTNIAKLATGMIKEHLQLLADLKQQLNSLKG